MLTSKNNDYKKSEFLYSYYILFFLKIYGTNMDYQNVFQIFFFFFCFQSILHTSIIKSKIIRNYFINLFIYFFIKSSYNKKGILNFAC